MRRTIVTLTALTASAGLLFGYAPHSEAAQTTTHHTPQMGPGSFTFPQVRTHYPHRACLTEDGTWCVWDARHMGNGIGRSFWTDHNDRVHYVTHREAHGLIWYWRGMHR